MYKVVFYPIVLGTLEGTKVYKSFPTHMQSNIIQVHGILSCIAIPVTKVYRYQWRNTIP